MLVGINGSRSVSYPWTIGSVASIPRNGNHILLTGPVPGNFQGYFTNIIEKIVTWNFFLHYYNFERKRYSEIGLIFHQIESISRVPNIRDIKFVHILG